MHRQRSQTRYVLSIAALLLAIVLAIFVRGRLLEFPLERDEGEFAYAGQLLLDGVSPYLTAYNMKFPGTYVAYAGLMALFGQTTTGVHLGLLFINVITIIVIFLFARALFDPLAAGAAAIAYALLSVSPGLLGMAAHATHFVALFAVLGVYALWSASKRRSRLLWVSAGCLFGIAILMKQHALFLAFFAVAFSLAHVTGSKREWRSNISDCALVALGIGLPFSVTCLWLWRAGVFDKFWFWTFEYARSYASRIPLSVGFEEFLFNGAIVARPTWPWGMVALAGIAALAFFRDERRLFLLSFLVASFLCVCLGFFLGRTTSSPCCRPSPCASVRRATGLLSWFHMSKRPVERVPPRVPLLRTLPGNHPAACAVWRLLSR